ncbi:MAG: hypothetical protein RL014_172 [Pseudomonadota bacterium]|jgi:hypothetical protein
MLPFNLSSSFFGLSGAGRAGWSASPAARRAGPEPQVQGQGREQERGPVQPPLPVQPLMQPEQIEIDLAQRVRESGEW